MSEFGPNFDRAQRNYDAMSPPEPLEHDLDTCAPCFCGGSATTIGVGTPNARLTCSSRRCGRNTRPGAHMENAIEEWNRSVLEDSCMEHDWLQIRGSRFQCRYCGAEKNLGSARA